jgi:hypothetical protein
MSTRAWTYDLPYAPDSHYIYDEIHLIWSLWTYLYFELMSNCKLRLRRDWRYQRGYQNPYIEEQTTQWPKRKSTKGQEEFEDTKGVIRIRISKKNRQNNGQKKKYKRTRRVWRYQRGNQNLYIEEEQTTQWPKEIVQKDKKSLKIPKG